MAQPLQLDNDRHIVRYLLGLLSDDEAQPFDEASTVDADGAARVISVEDDLVDGYVRGTLDAATRSQFESFYLSSPRRRARVEFARRFLATVDRVGGHATPQRGPSRSPGLEPVASRVARSRMFR